MNPINLKNLWRSWIVSLSRLESGPHCAVKNAIKLRIGFSKAVKKEVSLSCPSRSQNYDLLVSYIIPEALHTGLRCLLKMWKPEVL